MVALTTPKAGFVSKVPNDVSSEVKTLLGSVAVFKASKTYSAVKASLQHWDDEAVYDTPFMYIAGKDRIRCICSAFAPLGATLLDPKVVRIFMEDADKRAGVEVDATGHYAPTRTWWVWPSMLLPAKIPHETTLTLGVKSWSDRVDHVKERFHNLPALPFLLRWATGSLLGSSLALLEPLALGAWRVYDSAWVNISDAAAPAVASVNDITHNIADKVVHTIDAAKSKRT